MLFCHFHILGVVIKAHFDFVIGSPAMALCTSDTPTIRMEWYIDDKVIVSKNNTEELNLSFSPVNDSVSGRVFTCNVVRINETDNMEEQVNQSFVLTTKGIIHRTKYIELLSMHMSNPFSSIGHLIDGGHH